MDIVRLNLIGHQHCKVMTDKRGAAKYTNAVGQLLWVIGLDRFITLSNEIFDKFNFSKLDILVL